jgi:ACR3 family arsenite efflux pump ArsB
LTVTNALDIFGNGYWCFHWLLYSIQQWFHQLLSSGTTNVPLAIGLILMMYPPLTKIDFSKIPLMFEKPKLLTASFFFTWIIGPFLCFHWRHSF